MVLLAAFWKTRRCVNAVKGGSRGRSNFLCLDKLLLLLLALMIIKRPRGARAKRFYIRGAKPDTSAKKGVRVLVVDVIGALCLCCCWCARAARNPLSGVVGVGLLFLLLLLLLMFLVFAVDVVAGL